MSFLFLSYLVVVLAGLHVSEASPEIESIEVESFELGNQLLLSMLPHPMSVR